MLEGLGAEKEEDKDVDEVIPLPNIDSEVLGMVINWCEEQRNDSEPQKDEEEEGKRKKKHKKKKKKKKKKKTKKEKKAK